MPSNDTTSIRNNSDDRVSNCPSSVIPVEGQVDILTNLEASGWVWIPSLPNYALEVEAIVGERVVARSIANLPRHDLVIDRKCKGSHGFRLLFDGPLEPDAEPVIRAIAPVGVRLAGGTELPSAFCRRATPQRLDFLTMLINDHAQFTTSGHDFEEVDPAILDGANVLDESNRPLLLAFYLPQFHSIPENDRNWGKGFTEWRQLPRGMPRFPGHYQPRIPRDLGFYNLSTDMPMRAQVNLAKAAGIGGFGFYYYRFGCRRILETPIESFLASDLEMPFVIIWANESWTRTWTGGADDIALKQSYEQEHDELLVEDISRHIKDRRYIRLGGRPLFIIYRPSEIPNARSRIARWRSSISSKCGITPLIFMAQTDGDCDPRPYDLDGALEFPPHKYMDRVQARAMSDAYSTRFAGRVWEYDEFATASLQEENEAFPLIKTIVPSWDNEARYPNAGITLKGSSPKRYETWLKALILRAIATPVYGRPIVAINAWNEWAEGAYLEPDVYYGASFLNATARAYVAALRETREARQ